MVRYSIDYLYYITDEQYSSGDFSKLIPSTIDQARVVDEEIECFKNRYPSFTNTDELACLIDTIHNSRPLLGWHCPEVYITGHRVAVYRRAVSRILQDANIPSSEIIGIVLRLVALIERFERETEYIDYSFKRSVMDFSIRSFTTTNYATSSIVPHYTCPKCGTDLTKKLLRNYIDQNPRIRKSTQYEKFPKIKIECCPGVDA